MTEQIERKSKAGRKPLGERAMTVQEKNRRRRDKLKALGVRQVNLFLSKEQTEIVTRAAALVGMTPTAFLHKSFGAYVNEMVMQK